MVIVLVLSIVAFYPCGLLSFKSSQAFENPVLPVGDRRDVKSLPSDGEAPRYRK